MSSGGLANTFRNAKGLVHARFADLAGVDTLLDVLEERLPEAGDDPRQNRNLFFEPWIDAPQIGIPQETAEKVASFLHRIGVFRLWVRVRCPHADESEDGTVLETDDPEDFETVASASCDVCGQHHDWGWDDCETVYAFTTTLEEDERSFDYSKLRSPIVQVSADESRSRDSQRCETLVRAAPTQGSDDRPTRVLALALAGNTPLGAVPPPAAVWRNAWTGPCILLLAYMLLIMPVTYVCGESIAMLVSGVVVVITFLVIRGQVQAKLAPSIIQRTAMYLGFPLATLCIASGATGLRIDAEAGQNKPWWTRLVFGEQSWGLIVAGVLIVGGVLLFVFFYDYRRGWLR